MVFVAENEITYMILCERINRLKVVLVLLLLNMKMVLRY